MVEPSEESGRVEVRPHAHAGLHAAVLIGSAPEGLVLGGFSFRVGLLCASAREVQISKRELPGVLAFGLYPRLFTRIQKAAGNE
jgi:hypothetical protein